MDLEDDRVYCQTQHRKRMWSLRPWFGVLLRERMDSDVQSHGTIL